MSNVDVLKKMYRYFAEGNIEMVVSHWNKDIIWEACSGYPFITGNGTYKGPEAIVEGVFANMPKYQDDFKIEILDFIDGGDRVAMVGKYRGTWKATGKNFVANATHVWSFENGKASHFFQAVDTAEIINA